MSTGEGGGGETIVGGRAGSHAESPTDFRAYVYVGLMVIFGSTTAAAARYIVRELPPVWVPVVRFGVSGLLLLPVVADRRVLTRLFRRDWPLLLVAAAMCVPINQGFFLNAVRLGPTSHVGLFYATSPAGGPAAGLDVAAGAPRPRPALGRAGERRGCLHHRDRQRLARRRSSRLETRADDARRPPAHRRRPVLGRISHGQQAARHATRIVAGADRHVPRRRPARPADRAVRRSDDASRWSQVTPAAWIALAVLTLIITPVNLAAQNLAMRRLDASQVANFSNVSPILTVVWGAWLFGESLSASLIVGGALTLAGVVWTGWSRPQPSSAVEPLSSVDESSAAGSVDRDRQGPTGPVPIRRRSGRKGWKVGETRCRTVLMSREIVARRLRLRTNPGVARRKRRASRMSRGGRGGGVAVYVTSHGFGHLNRSAAVVNRIPRRRPGLDPFAPEPVRPLAAAADAAHRAGGVRLRLPGP